jgi:8-oxo-dGTP pyrophosphatase MutT (NUDIX family)
LIRSRYLRVMAVDETPEHPRTEWREHGSRSLYQSRWLDLQLVDVTAPDGTRFEHHVVRMQRVAVATVLDDARERVLMLQRHRFIDNSWGWEVPVGIVEPDEDAAATAAREVEEETGWRPTGLRRVISFQPAIGIADTPHELFVGHGAQRIGEPADITEAQQVMWVPVNDLLGMVNDGRIRDGATLVAVLHLLASGRGA